MPVFLFIITNLVEIRRNLEIASGIFQTGLIEFFCFILVFFVLKYFKVDCWMFFCCIYLLKFASYFVDFHLSLIS